MVEILDEMSQHPDLNPFLDMPPGTQYTLLVPSDEAFSRIGLKKMTLTQKADLIRYHIIPAFHTLQSFSDHKHLHTLLGDEVVCVHHRDGDILINGAKVIQDESNVSSDPGSILHHIDRVLLRPEMYQTK